MNSKPDFKRSYISANEILVSSSVIQTFPFSPIDLVREQSDIVCRSYRKARKYGVEIADLGSKSAIIVMYGDKSIIFYDETKPRPHVTYSIIHEFGHYKEDHDFNKKDEESYHKFEIEANFFAAQLLMPEQIIRELQHRGIKIDCLTLQKIFGVSAQAANKRIETLAKTNIEWHSRAEKEFDDLILYRYANFLNKICPENYCFDFEGEIICQRTRNEWLYQDRKGW